MEPPALVLSDPVLSFPIYLNWYIPVKLNCKVQPRPDVKCHSKKRNEEIEKLKSYPKEGDLQAGCEGMLLYLSVPYFVYLWSGSNSSILFNGIDVTISWVNREVPGTLEVLQEPLLFLLEALHSKAASSLLPVSSTVGTAFSMLCNCVPKPAFEYLSLSLYVLPFISWLSNFFTLRDHKTPWNQGFIKLYIPFYMLHLAGTK